MSALQKIIDIELEEVGYIEKASNANLDSETANKGLNNYTKYSRDINALGLKGYQGSAWCCTHQFWVEVQAVGLEQALKNWNMTKSTYVGYNCFATYNAFKAVGKTSKKPKVGCLVVFTFSHIGRVIAINGDIITTVEGNTSSATYERNGGMVAKKTYKYNDPKIKGYCIIDYAGTVATSPYLQLGSEGKYVKELQENLNKLGYDCGAVDGDFGSKTEKAVIKFQTDNDLEPDGIVGQATDAKIKKYIADLDKKTTTSTDTSNPAYNAKIKEGQKWLNTNYGDKLTKYCGGKLTENGIYDDKVRAAIVCVWKDLMNRKFDTNLTPSNSNFLSSCEKAADNATIRKGDSGTFVYLAKMLLVAENMHSGKMSAEYDDDMYSSMIKYQKKVFPNNSKEWDGIGGAKFWMKIMN